MVFNYLKQIICLPLILPHLLVYCFMNKATKDKIKLDIEAFHKLGGVKCSADNYVRIFIQQLVLRKEFRNVFYMRTGPRISRLLNLFLHKNPWLAIQDNSDRFGGGFLVQHGNSTIVLANSIGENFWVNQNVTVGWTEKGCPTIGDNVRIGTGAVVLGPIHIGSNVNIGAGAIVLKDVPSNTTVVSPMARIVKKDGARVDLPL